MVIIRTAMRLVMPIAHACIYVVVVVQCIFVVICVQKIECAACSRLRLQETSQRECLVSLNHMLLLSHTLSVTAPRPCLFTHSQSHTHIHSLSLVLVVMMEAKEFKTKIYSHAHSLILSQSHSLSHTLSHALFVSHTLCDTLQPLLALLQSLRHTPLTCLCRWND